MAEMLDGAKVDCADVVGVNGIRSVMRNFLNTDFRGHDLMVMWPIADVDTES